MFRKPQSIRLAAGMGLLTALTCLVVGVSATTAIPKMNPFTAVDWELQIQAAAARFPEQFFAGGILVLLYLCAGFFFFGLAVRASRMHPTSAAVGGGLLLGAVALAGLQRIWDVFGTDLFAVRYVTVENADMRATWQHAFQLGKEVDGVLIAAALTLAIPGSLAMAHALRDLTRLERLVPVAFLLAGITQFLAMLAVGYVFNVGRIEHTFNRIALGLSMLGVWAMPVIACTAAAWWLFREADRPESVPREVAMPRAA